MRPMLWPMSWPMLWMVVSVGFLLTADVVTKQLVSAKIEVGGCAATIVLHTSAYDVTTLEPYVRSTELAALVHVPNHGGPFGLLQPNEVSLSTEHGMTPGFWMFRIAISAVIAMFAWRHRAEIVANRLLRITAILAVAGSLGNIVDQFVYGYVLDWLVTLPFPWAYNLADAYLFSLVPLHIVAWMVERVGGRLAKKPLPSSI